MTFDDFVSFIMIYTCSHTRNYVTFHPKWITDKWIRERVKERETEIITKRMNEYGEERKLLESWLYKLTNVWRTLQGIIAATHTRASHTSQTNCYSNILYSIEKCARPFEKKIGQFSIFDCIISASINCIRKRWIYGAHSRSKKYRPTSCADAYKNANDSLIETH